MAYTKTPMQDTYQTKSIGLMQKWETRDISNLKDVDTVNVVWDVVKDGVTGESYFEAIKRDGIRAYTNVPAGGPIYGAYYWAFTGLYVVIRAAGAEIFDVDGNVLGFSAGVFADGYIGFTEFQYSTGIQELIITDGFHLYRMDTAGVLTAIVDPDRPVTHVPYPVFLDGYLFLADLQGNIWNSDNDNPSSWSPSNFIAAESYPDPIIALARSGQYIVSFGASSIQFFYDAANPTGTPLAVQTTSVRTGYRGGLVQHGDRLYFIGHEFNEKSSVCVLEGLKIQSIAEPVVTRRLSEFQTNPANNDFFTFGALLNINGHLLYTWRDYSVGFVQPFNTVYAVDLDTKLWTRLTVFNNAVFDIRSSAIVSSHDEEFTVITLVTDVQPYRFSSTQYQDTNINFTVQFTTKNEDFGTRRQKFGGRLLLSCDQTPSSSLMQVSWSDNDYQTFTTPRSIDVSSTYPCLWALGSFRKRAYRFTYTDNFPMRWQSVEIDYNQGDA